MFSRRELNLEGGGGGSVLRNQFEGEVELKDQLSDPDAPTLASQDKLKVSPKGLPFVNSQARFLPHSGKALQGAHQFRATLPGRLRQVDNVQLSQ